MPIIGLTFSF